jgi:hypothetical protein
MLRGEEGGTWDEEEVCLAGAFRGPEFGAAGDSRRVDKFEFERGLYVRGVMHAERRPVFRAGGERLWAVVYGL